MRNLLVIAFCVILWLLSFATGLFQSVPTFDPVRVFSKENILLNVGLLILALCFFGAYYLVRHILSKSKKQRTRKQKAIEGLFLVSGSVLVVGFAMVFGLIQKIPLFRYFGVGSWFDKDRILFNSVVVIGVTLLSALSYWIRVIVVKPYDDDDEEE